jgi:hypothetical protein
MKKGVTKEIEGPVGPDGAFMTFGHCKACGKYDTIYLYGELKGVCGLCVVDYLAGKMKGEGVGIKIAPELLKELHDVEKIMKKDESLTLKEAIDKNDKRRKNKKRRKK